MAHGLGVSVVPERRGAPFPPGLRRLALEGPDAFRRLALIEREGNPKARLTAALRAELTAVAG